MFYNLALNEPALRDSLLNEKVVVWRIEEASEVSNLSDNSGIDGDDRSSSSISKSSDKDSLPKDDLNRATKGKVGEEEVEVEKW